MKKLGKKNYEVVETVESYSDNCNAIHQCVEICKEKYSVAVSVHQQYTNIAAAYN